MLSSMHSLGETGWRPSVGEACPVPIYVRFWLSLSLSLSVSSFSSFSIALDVFPFFPLQLLYSLPWRQTLARLLALPLA
jgi:hypothetical protein